MSKFIIVDFDIYWLNNFARRHYIIKSEIIATKVSNRKNTAFNIAYSVLLEYEEKENR